MIIPQTIVFLFKAIRSQGPAYIVFLSFRDQGMHIVTPKLVPKTYNNMIQAPVIQTIQTQSLVKLSYFRSAIGVYSLFLKARVDFCLNLFLKNMMKKSTCSDANQIQLRESAWSTGGLPCIWLVIQCKVRSFLIFFT